MSAVSNSIRQRADYFFREEAAPGTQLARAFEALGHRGKVYAFGGLLRRIALFGNQSLAADIDLVVEPSVDLARVLNSYSHVKNSFGGYRVTIGRWLLDIWSIQDTWAFRNGCVAPVSFESLLSTTFFNLDAIAFDIGARRIHSNIGTLEAIQKRLLDINLETNPNPPGMVVRSLRALLFDDLFVGRHLADYVVRHLDRVRWSDLMALERAKYRNAILFGRNMRLIQQELTKFLFSDATCWKIKGDQLPLDLPTRHVESETHP